MEKAAEFDRLKVTVSNQYKKRMLEMGSHYEVCVRVTKKNARMRKLQCDKVDRLQAGARKFTPVDQHSNLMYSVFQISLCKIKCATLILSV